jgi:hypothetical protein
MSIKCVGRVLAALLFAVHYPAHACITTYADCLRVEAQRSFAGVPLFPQACLNPLGIDLDLGLLAEDIQ